MDLNLSLNLVRILITLISFAVFVAIVLHAWRAGNATAFKEAAALPFADEPSPAPHEGHA